MPLKHPDMRTGHPDILATCRYCKGCVQVVEREWTVGDHDAEPGLRCEGAGTRPLHYEKFRHQAASDHHHRGLAYD
jgi:hypothetical protein